MREKDKIEILKDILFAEEHEFEEKIAQRRSLQKSIPQTLGPVITETLKEEIRLHKDEVVDALYPILGKMVKKYVAQEMKLLSAKMNNQLGFFSFLEKKSKVNLYRQERKRTHVTIGVHITKKVVEISVENEVSLILWDLEGTDDIATIRNSYLLGTHGAVFVFDVSRPSTFEHLKDDLKIISDKMPKIQKGVFDLHKFFELLIFTYKAKAKEKGLKFDCLWDEKIPKLVEGDRLRTLSNRNQFDR
ncbi:Ras-related protein Rab-14 [Nymphon striatum]|nr:Ras-related protein Rab-14 [Nymphon striatum]